MGKVLDKDFFKETKTELPSNLFFLYGDEKHFIEKAYKQLLKYVPDIDNNLTLMNEEKLDLNRLEDIIETMPFMVERKAVVVRDCNIEKLNTTDLDKLLNIVKDVPEYTLLIFCHTNIVLEKKDASKTKHHKKLFKAIEKVGITCEFNLLQKADLKRALCQYAKKQDMVLDMQIADMLVERTTTSYILLVKELDKCIHFAKSKGSIHVTQEDIESCTVASVTVSIFNLANFILSGKYDMANQILQDLIYTKEEPIKIVGYLAGAFGDLYRAKCAINCGVSAAQVKTDFKYANNRLFVVDNSFTTARRYSTDQIRACIESIYETDIKLKSSKMDNILLLEKMLADICYKISRR